MSLIGPADGRFVNSAEVMQAIAGQWSDIGVKANVQALAYDQWINTISASGSFDGAAFADEKGFDPTEFYGLYTGKGAYSHVPSDAKLNQLQSALVNSTGDARATAAAALADYNNQQCYLLPLYGDNVLYGMKGVNWTPWSVDSSAYMGNAFPA
jgi:ABC-type transport system substrate-binding protein